MPFEVYDFRDVNKNVLTTPEIRARLYHMEPGQVDRLHSHDLGHEIFLILEGKAEFMIAGHTEVLEAGQLCIALADEIHQVRNLLPDRRTVMFLSVTPHIQPTHTGRDPDGSVHPPQFRTNTFYDDVDDTGPIADLLDTFVHDAEALADEAPQATPPAPTAARPAPSGHAANAHAAGARQAAATHAQQAENWRKADAAADRDAAVAARNTMWQAVRRLHTNLFKLDLIWNRLAPRADENANS